MKILLMSPKFQVMENITDPSKSQSATVWLYYKRKLWPYLKDHKMTPPAFCFNFQMSTQLPPILPAGQLKSLSVHLNAQTSGSYS